MNSQNVPEGGCSFHRVLASFILQLGLDALWPRVPFIGRILLWVLWQHISLTAFLVKCRGLVCATVAAEDKGEAFKIKLYFWEGINSLICLSNSPRGFSQFPHYFYWTCLWSPGQQLYNKLYHWLKPPSYTHKYTCFFIFFSLHYKCIEDLHFLQTENY